MIVTDRFVWSHLPTDADLESLHDRDPAWAELARRCHGATLVE